jgi:uncharacterized surface protein with fasciclin (FAS1) repeats
MKSFIFLLIFLVSFPTSSATLFQFTSNLGLFVASLIERASLDEFLSNETASLTLFAPNDQAFDNLPPAVVTYLDNSPDVLAEVLRGHLVDEELTLATLATLNGTDLVFLNVRILKSAAFLTVK